MTANLPEVREIGFPSISQFKESLTRIGRSPSEVCEVCRCSNECVPHVDRSVTSRFHGKHLVQESAMEPFRVTIMSRSV